MGSSKAKKSAKKADFLKPKLKVGKTRPTATNVTNTSFRSKGIVLKNQALSTDLPSLKTQISTHIAHLSSRSESQRKESLAALVNASTRIKVPTQLALDKALPLITDGSSAVREQLLAFLRTLPAEQCNGFEAKTVLYLQTGMTHIASGVCRAALDVLEWASETFGVHLVSCPGGWYKILKCFLLLLGWKHDDATRPTSKEWSGGGNAIEKLNKEPKLVVKVLEALAAFLNLGLRLEPQVDRASIDPCTVFCPHLMPMHAKPFARLGLFDAPTDVENQLYADVPARNAIFDTQFRYTIQQGLQVAKRHGGELGRAAGQVTRAIAKSAG